MSICDEVCDILKEFNLKEQDEVLQKYQITNEKFKKMVEDGFAHKRGNQLLDINNRFSHNIEVNNSITR